MKFTHEIKKALVKPWIDQRVFSVINLDDPYVTDPLAGSFELHWTIRDKVEDMVFL